MLAVHFLFLFSYDASSDTSGLIRPVNKNDIIYSATINNSENKQIFYFKTRKNVTYRTIPLQSKSYIDTDPPPLVINTVYMLQYYCLLITCVQDT